MIKNLLILLLTLSLAWSCKPDEYQLSYSPTPYSLDIPDNFPPFPEDTANPLTVEGVLLGRKLFYEKKLSGDNSMSCASCHNQNLAFTDPLKFSVGIDGVEGKRNAMPLFNLAYADRFFWDGRATSLAAQALDPVRDPVEMHETWTNAVRELEEDPEYPSLFLKAFGSPGIDSMRAVKAIAQFERILISGNSKFDKFLRFEVQLDSSELRGFNLFKDDFGGDCWHCHPPFNLQFTDFQFRNNGLDTVFQDSGLAAVTGDPFDLGKFKVPSLRNVEFTAPYMHDGRFETLEEVIEHYNMGGHDSPTIDVFMKHVGTGLNLKNYEKQALVNFLKTLSDPEFLENPAFSDPN